MPHSPRGRRRTPYTAAGPVTTTAVDGRTWTAQPYSSRELRSVVEERTTRPRRATCCRPPRPCERCTSQLYLPRARPVLDERGKRPPARDDAAVVQAAVEQFI